MDGTFDHARLRRARRAAGMSQQDLADAAGVRQATVSMWESGRRSPHPTKMSALATALGIDAAELMPGLGGSDRTLGDYRQAIGLSQGALAARLELNPHSLAGIERGRYWPTAHVTAWRRQLGISAKQFQAAWWRSRLRYHHD